MSTSRPDVTANNDKKKKTVEFDDGVKHEVSDELFKHIRELGKALKMAELALMMKDMEIARLKDQLQNGKAPAQNDEDKSAKLVALLRLIGSLEAAKHQHGNNSPKPERQLPQFAALFGGNSNSGSSSPDFGAELDSPRLGRK